MTRYIDAEETIRRIDLFIEGGSVFKSVLRSIKRLINNVPTADVVEVVHGEWELAGEQFHIEKVYLCTACRNYEAWGEYEKTPYCPNCGAKMDGKKVD